ncbi:sodium channel protein Nach [Andrena cerasifolii]|uniref:sodium channel protein Nach n=1 Tax=Andrena cerasifolii TaxID=2819439 RepID=UPI0040378C12
MRTYEANESLEYRKKHNALWGSSDRRKRLDRSHFTRTLAKHVKLYCKYTKLAGFKYIVDSSATWFDRVLWSLLYAITVPAMIYTIYHGYLDFIQHPCMTSVETEYFPTQNLNFPGVSICSVNRISRHAAMELANEVFRANVSRFSLEEILGMISQLGDLYDSEFLTQNRSHRIDQLLARYYHGYYDITDVMQRLTPLCEDILLRCRFQADERNCSEIFMFRKTQDGFCCTFNYATKGDDIPLKSGVDHKVEPLKVDNLGEENGLSVLLEPFLNDYFHSLLPITGWKVTLFNPHDYPDATSGGVMDVLVSPRTELSVATEAIVSYSTKNIIPYSLGQRHCVFAEEMAPFRSSYTYSDCIVDCKIEDVWRICNCIHFYLPNRESRRVCNLADVPCLNRHKSKWFSVIPHEDHDTDFIANKTWMLHCLNCYPECSDVRYSAKMFEARLAPGHHNTELLDGFQLENQSVLHVYFSRFGAVKLRQDVVFRWYELLSDASGIGGIFIGFSLIGVMELVYFVWIFVCDLLAAPSSSRANEIQAELKRPKIQSIYWGELYPRTRPNVMTHRRGGCRDKY